MEPSQEPAMEPAMEPGSTPQEITTVLLDLPHELLAHILEHIIDHVGIIGLATSCKVIHSHVSIYDRFRTLAALRGWSASPMQISSRLVCRQRTDEDRQFTLRPLVPLPNGWLSYGERVGGMPSPHKAWELGAGRTLTVGSGPRNNWAQFASVRDAVKASAEGDSLLLLAGTYDEGQEPIEIKHSIRLIGDGGEESSAQRPQATVLQAVLIATGGQSSMCGLTLALPADADASAPGHPPHAGLAGGLANLLVGDGEALQEDNEPEGPSRCLWVTQGSIFTCEDCHIVGGVRAGSRSELALIGCRVVGGARRGLPASTGLLVQGSARMLVRACVIEGHERSGITAQHGASLWVHHSCVAACALTGIKLISRAPCVISASSIARNGRFGLLLRERAHALIISTELADNGSAGVACIHKSNARLEACDILGNGNYGVVCQHESKMSMSRSVVRGNGGNGVMVLQDAMAVLAASTFAHNRGAAHQSDGPHMIDSQDNLDVDNGREAPPTAPPPSDDERDGQVVRPAGVADVGPCGEAGLEVGRLDQWPPELQSADRVIERAIGQLQASP